MNQRQVGVSVLKKGGMISKSRNDMCSVVQSCLTLCDAMDCSPPGSSVHGIL